MASFLMLLVIMVDGSMGCRLGCKYGSGADSGMRREKELEKNWI